MKLLPRKLALSIQPPPPKHRFLLDIDGAQWAELQSMLAWHKKFLHTRVTAACAFRLAMTAWLEEQKAERSKAEAGKLHAKQRK